MLLVKRILLSALVAFIITITVSTIAWAGGPYYVSEQANYPYFSVFDGQLFAATGCTNKCANNNAKYTKQAGFDNNYPWTFAYWRPGVSNVKSFCAYTPGIGVAGVQYSFLDDQDELYYVVLNQAYHKNSYRYLGYLELSSNTGAELWLSSSCVSGFACDGRNVYWDKILYTTYPTNASCNS
ncbi:MAG: hypothetical protein Fur0022_33480 [Anaerolineales bacterium]